jgi:hypothetical protein
VRVEKVPHGGIPADQYDLLEGRTAAALLEQPEKALHGYVHDIVGSLLAGGAMEHVRDSLHGLAHCMVIGNASLHDFQARTRLQEAVVAQGTDAQVAVVVRPKNSVNEMAPDFAGSARDQDALRDIRA